LPAFPALSSAGRGGGGGYSRGVGLFFLDDAGALRLLFPLGCFLGLIGRARFRSIVGGGSGLLSSSKLFSGGMGRHGSIPLGRTVWV
jgi:hypothetical protein